ncbi:MAG: helix-turn-helix domain-containing protein [Chitinivibrionales bacterium]|nr:helix-turn-helix domain-containing protein [Chitinivibrionales bacterium]MBD3394553.1 helix-turn-helix domain-containing protein [Chitinivibrionales bacterium]
MRPVRSNRLMTPPRCVILFLLVAWRISQSSAAGRCLEFAYPVSGTHITGKTCTLAVDACSSVRSVALRARYLAQDSKTARMKTLGNITRPPFKLIWDLSDLPIQLGPGMTLYAEARLADGSARLRKQEGIFLTHYPVETPEYAVTYRAADKPGRVRPLELTSTQTSASARAYVTWDENALLFRIEVRDPLFYNSLPKRKLTRMGVEILIDPKSKRDAYASENTVIVSIPVIGEPQRVQSRPRAGEDGSFELVRSSERTSFETNVIQADFKGYRVSCAIPWSAFDNGRPGSFGCNILARALDKSTSVQTLSWAGQKGEFLYSPYVWGTMRVAGKPLFANVVLLWAASCLAGFGLGAGLALLYRNMSRFGSPLARFEHSEEDQRLYETITTAVHENVTDRSMTLEDLSQRLAVSPRKVNQLVHRNNGESFHDFVMRSRIEIAKERLRSSHSSEAAIASSCGFTSVDEMEKYFRRFCRTTPYKFREEYQVT